MSAIMVKYLFGGPEFLHKIYLMENLNVRFSVDNGSRIVDVTESKSINKVIVIVADGHRTNQKWFLSMSTYESEHAVSWCSKHSNSYLLFDYLYFVKCITNNWLPEKTQQL